MTDEELANAPAGIRSAKMTGLGELNFVMTASVLDCTGCGSCANVCPGKKGVKALEMKPRRSPPSSATRPSRAASSGSRCLNSPAPAAAAAKRRMPSW